MTKVLTRKRALALVIVACVCAAIAAVPAYAYYYAHNEEHVEEQNQGVMEVVFTLDETAVGGGVHTDIVFVAEDATAQDAIEEAVVGSTAANDPDAIKDHVATPVTEYLADKTYTVSVYEAASQEPGTQTTYDTESVGDASTQLNRYDSVVVTVM